MRSHRIVAGEQVDVAAANAAAWRDAFRRAGADEFGLTAVVSTTDLSAAMGRAARDYDTETRTVYLA